MDPEDEYIEESDFEASDIEEDPDEIKNSSVKKKNIKIGEDIDIEDGDDINELDDIDIEDDDDEIDPEDDDDDIDLDDDENENKINSFINNENSRQFELSDEEDSDDDDENYLQKFDDNLEKNIIDSYYPELHSHNYEEVENMAKVVRNQNGEIIDPFHTTLPFITRYEKARIIGERAKQLNAGAMPMVKHEPSLIDGYLIALKEFEEKKIPFIVKRPLPNGACEYWKFADLEILV
jgi:DNA-directed RNA polymerase I, II, and III subunit RPABC2